MYIDWCIVYTPDFLILTLLYPLCNYLLIYFIGAPDSLAP